MARAYASTRSPPARMGTTFRPHCPATSGDLLEDAAPRNGYFAAHLPDSSGVYSGFNGFSDFAAAGFYPSACLTDDAAFRFYRVIARDRNF